MGGHDRGPTIAERSAFYFGGPHYGLIMMALIGAAVVSLCLYFLPAYVAYRRDHDHRLAVLYCNLVLGWTVVGWLYVMIWAACGLTRVQAMYYRWARMPALADTEDTTP